MNSIEDQERFDAVKEWWRQYGNYILVAVVSVVLGLGGGGAWVKYNKSRALEASQKYDQLQKLSVEGKVEESRLVFSQLVEEFGGTAYRDLAVLKMVNLFHRLGDFEEAETQLRDLLKDTKSEETKSLARLRLASILIDLKKYDDALVTVEMVQNPGYGAIVADLKADILFNKGKISEAIKVLENALSLSDSASSWRGIIEMKKDSLESQK